MNSSVPTVRLTDVSKLYETDRERSAGVHHISLEAYRGEMVLFLGPSGSGKTTLLTLAAGLLEPTSGSVELLGKEICALSPVELQQLRALRMGFVFQTFRLIDALTAEENVALVRRLERNNRRSVERVCVDLLEKFGIGHLRKSFPRSLSQGEKQRLAIARALANDPELIIADEPTASLATEDSFEVIQTLHNAARTHGKCVLIATHDLRLKEYADRVIIMRDGRLANDEKPN